jgi:hypothetical protein
MNAIPRAFEGVSTHQGEQPKEARMADQTPVYLNQEELAHRFRVSPRTLERWRWLKTGPDYTKLGGKVVYALDDVEAYERRRRAETHSAILGSWR